MKVKVKILFIFLLAFVTFLIPSKVSATDTINIKTKGIYNYTYAQEVLELLNSYRKENGKNELKMDEELLEAAMIRAGEINIYFNHTRPDGTDCFTASNKMTGENIAGGQPSASSVMQSWKESTEGHNEAMLEDSYNSVGIGCFQLGSSCYWVQCFGTEEATSESSKTGTISVTQTVSILDSLVEVYAYTVNDSTNAKYMRPGNTGYFQFGVANQGWYGRYAPGDASDYNFSSSNSNIIKMNSDGTFEAVGEGQATISLSLKVDPSKKYSETISVQKDDINVDYLYTINLMSEYDYTGRPIEPKFSIYYTMSKLLEEGKDYTLTYQNNIWPGTATVTITGIGQYKGSITKTFKIVSNIVSPNIENYLFDATYYADRYADLKAIFGYNESSLRSHWLNYGIKEGRSASPVFDPVYYINKNPDLKNAFGTDYVAAYNHFIQFGINEGRTASKYFDVDYYLSNNSDVNSAFCADRPSALVHFMQYGINEGRRGSNNFYVISYYNSQNSYTKKQLGKTYLKYYALADGGNPINDSPINITNYLFDSKYYADKYPDLKAAFGYNESSLRSHWLNFGIKEGRSASPVFDPVYYINKYQDLKSAFGTDYLGAYNHFIQFGINEGRQASSTFNVVKYINNYSDLKETFGPNYSKALEHYMQFGRNEGRKAV